MSSFMIFQNKINKVLSRLFLDADCFCLLFLCVMKFYLASLHIFESSDVQRFIIKVVVPWDYP